jgi:flagellar biosynthetic protein FlhB
MPADQGEKTEPATPRRRMEARSKGQVPRSHELAVAVMLLGGIIVLDWLGPLLWQKLLQNTRMGLTLDGPPTADDLGRLFVEMGLNVAPVLGPIVLLVMLVGVAVLLGQVGWLFTWQPLMPTLSRLNPVNGVKRLVSPRSAVTAAINLAKLIVVATVAYLTVHAEAAAILFSSNLDGPQAFALGAALCAKLVYRLAAILLLLALIDYAYQRYRHERDLRMTKEEVKDELRSMEGDPVIKRRRRQVQMQLAMQRLRRDVPQADVVVTNPTHLAIALRYRPDEMPAPKVVAKGADYVAVRIRQLARELGIPIVERKPLARALYEVVEVGQYIPERFYRAIAEILAYVYELTGRSPFARRATKTRDTAEAAAPVGAG